MCNGHIFLSILLLHVPMSFFFNVFQHPYLVLDVKIYGYSLGNQQPWLRNKYAFYDRIACCLAGSWLLLRDTKHGHRYHHAHIFRFSFRFFRFFIPYSTWFPYSHRGLIWRRTLNCTRFMQSIKKTTIILSSVDDRC